MPLTVEVTLLPGHGAPLLESYPAALARGQAEPPDLIAIGIEVAESYQPAAARQHVVLVGKGITFDSGGLSLKLNDNMGRV